MKDEKSKIENFNKVLIGIAITCLLATVTVFNKSKENGGITLLIALGCAFLFLILNMLFLIITFFSKNKKTDE